jgi:hypothetical protein
MLMGKFIVRTYVVAKIPKYIALIKYYLIMHCIISLSTLNSKVENRVDFIMTFITKEMVKCSQTESEEIRYTKSDKKHRPKKKTRKELKPITHISLPGTLGVTTPTLKATPALVSSPRLVLHLRHVGHALVQEGGFLLALEDNEVHLGAVDL